MSVLEAFFLGVVQGLTEFLPISSTGHLILVEHVLGIRFNPIDLQGLNVMLHAGTLVALLALYFENWKNIALAPFRKDSKNQKLLVALIIATIPGAVIGVLFEEQFATLFTDPVSLAVCFLINAFVLLLAESSRPEHPGYWWNPLRFLRRKQASDLTLISAFFIGVAQACALPAAISRSGLTISAGQLFGLDRRTALDFSFLMLTPIVAGATLLTGLRVWSGDILLPDPSVTLTGISTSFVFSAFAILFLRQFVARYSLTWFVPYLIGVSVLILL